MTQCAADQVQIAPPTATEDRQCETVCPAGSFQLRERVSNVENTRCKKCGEFSFKPQAGNEPGCNNCPRGHKANLERTQCYAWSCSHIACRLEKHKCANKPAYPAGAKTCTGGWHKSIRVFHTSCGLGAPTFAKGCQETVCVQGHHCGLGFLTGDTTKCECRPTLPSHHMLPCRHARTETKPLKDRITGEWTDACLDK